MFAPFNQNESYNVGFISTRFASTDGVSLETSKWAEILKQLGHKCFYFAGVCDRPVDVSMVVPKAFYRDPEVLQRHNNFFGKTKRTPNDTDWIQNQRGYFREMIAEFVCRYNIDLLIAENVLTIPLHIPFALGLTEYIAETGIATIAHHHDFVWERKRFLLNALGDYIGMAFPPNLHSIQHVVINTLAQSALASRCGLSSILVPNVMNYDYDYKLKDGYANDLRDKLDIPEDELFVLQPTRIIQRKGIEHSIELISRLKMKGHLVISHASGDEGDDYAKRILNYAKRLNVRLVFSSHLVTEERGITPDGIKRYNLPDVYSQCDLVTYPSVYEGFGNAFLEAIAFRKPIVVQNYSVYATDIKPKGFRMIEFDEYITDNTIEQIHVVLEHPELCQQMCEENIRLANRFYSYSTLRYKLQTLVFNAFGATS